MAKPLPRSASSRAAPVDGRTLRGARNRDQIVDAIIDLIRGGDLDPTAEQVAERAGVGTRSVYRHFADKEGLLAAVSGRMVGEVLAILDRARFEGSLEARIRALVRCRIEAYEHIAPFQRRRGPAERLSPEVRRNEAKGERRGREQLRDALGDSSSASDPDAIEALSAWLSWDSWNRLRTVQRLGASRAAALLERVALDLVRTSERRNPR